MANKVLGIEIGQNLTRVVEMDYKVKNPKIYNMFSFATPEDMVSADGSIVLNPLFGSALKGQLKEKRISTTKAIFVLNSSRIANREIELPNVKDNKIKDLLMANASDYFPVDLSQYQLIHEVLGRTESEEDKKVKLSVIAVPNDIIKTYELLAQSCNITLMGLDYTGNAIKQLMNREIPGEVKVTIKVDEAASILTIMEGEEVKLQRILNYGIGEAVEEIQDSLLYGDYMSFMDSVDIARRKTFVNLRFDSEAIEFSPDGTGGDGDGEIGVDSEKFKALKNAVTDNLRTLIGSFARVLDYYQSRNQDKTIERIFLVGMGADFSGLSKLMSNELNYKVVPLQQFDGLLLHKNIVLTNVKVAEFFTCIGATLKPLPIYTQEKKKKGLSLEGGQEEESESYTLPIVVAGVLVLVGLVLTGMGFLNYQTQRAENVSLNNQVAELEYAEEIANEYQSTLATYNWFKNIDETTTTHNNNLKNFIEELEQKLPSQARIVAFTADEEGVTMTFTIQKVEAAADIIEIMRGFDSVYVDSITEISEDEDDSGASTIEFGIVLMYGDASEETETTEVSTETTTETTAE